jgi:hypothetical protein
VAVDRGSHMPTSEAKAFIMQHRAAVLAIAEALMIERTLNSVIDAAPERMRRVEWAKVLKNSAGFATMSRWFHPNF